MNRLESEKKYEEIKGLHKASAREKEKRIKRDLALIMSSATPRFLREKLVTSCIVFGSVYLVEELIFRKRVPGIVKFVGAVSATAFAPKIYRTLYANFYPATQATAPVPTYSDGDLSGSVLPPTEPIVPRTSPKAE